MASTLGNSFNTLGSGSLDGLMCQVDASLCRSVPPVSAGSDVDIAYFDLPVVLNGQVSSASVPVQWSVVGGNSASVHFSNPNSLNPTVNFTQGGTFTLRLSTTQPSCGVTSSDDMLVHAANCATKLDVMLLLDVSSPLSDIDFGKAKSA